MFTWHDPDDDVIYEMRYVVTQSDDEGPEYVEWRVKPEMAGSLGKAAEYVHGDGGWMKLPPWATPPDEAMEHWHGKVTKIDRLTSSDFNDLLGATYRLMKDLKRLGLIPEEFKAIIE